MYYIAKLMVNSGMVAAGYDTIVFDSGWFNPTRDTNGLLYAAPNILVAPYYTNAVSTWPMPNVVADLHAIGIPHVGLYYFDPSTVPNAANQLRHPENLPIELDADTFASLGVDYVKFDAVNLTNNDLQYLRRFSTEFLKKVPQGRIQMGVASGVNLDAIPCSLDWCGSYQAVADGLADDLREAPNGYDWVDWGTLIFLHSLDNAVYFNSKVLAQGRLLFGGRAAAASRLCHEYARRPIGGGSGQCAFAGRAARRSEFRGGLHLLYVAGAQSRDD